jgi:hypothetical protein
MDAPAQFREFRLRNRIHVKGTDSGLVTACLLRNWIHSFIPSEKEEKEKARARSKRC